MTDEPDWESIARRLLADALIDQSDTTTEVVQTLAASIREGDSLSREELTAVRVAITGLQSVVEEEIAPIVPDAKPYEDAADAIPTTRLREALDGLEK